MASERKDNEGLRNAALDLARHGLAVCEGSSWDGNKIWHLTCPVWTRPPRSWGGR